jgi:exonuclease SbcD
LTEAIRLLHFADIHVGMENYGRMDPATGTSTRVRDFLDRLDEVIEYALAHDVDVAVFAGDAFKNRDPEPTQQREFAHRIKKLADAVPTLLLVGNHDMPGMAVKASSVDIFRALDVPGVIVGYKPDGQIVDTKRGPIYLAWMPYPMRNRLLSREEHHGKSIDELDLVLRQAVSDILRDLAQDASRYDMPRVLAGHFSVAEAKLGSERSVMLGRDVTVTTSTLADETWDYVALGHIHKHQALNSSGAPPVVYSGSLERIDFGEEAEPKGFCWVELLRGNTHWEFVPVKARPFKTLRADIRQMAEPTQAILDQLEPVPDGAVVRVIVSLRAEQQAGLRDRDVEAALPQAASFSLVREVEIETRARLGDLAPEALTPEALVRAYFESRNTPPERMDVLLESARDLIQSVDPHP